MLQCLPNYPILDTTITANFMFVPVCKIYINIIAKKSIINRRMIYQYLKNRWFRSYFNLFCILLHRVYRLVRTLLYLEAFSRLAHKRENHTYIVINTARDTVAPVCTHTHKRDVNVRVCKSRISHNETVV